MVFISFSITRWDGPWYVRQKLMQALSAEHKVIYVNPRAGLKQTLQKLLKLDIGIRRVDGVLVIEGFILPKIYRLPWLDRILDWLYHRLIKTIAFVMDSSRILYVWEPAFSSFLKHYPNDPYIYHPYDRFDLYNHKSTRKEDEQELVRNAILLYTVSEKLCDYYAETFGRRPMLIENGVSADYFKPFAWTQREGTKIGYSGSIKGALNLDIVMRAAPLCQDCSFMFYGPIRYAEVERYDTKLRQFLCTRNISACGCLPVKELPAALAQMDILLMLYSEDEGLWTHYSGPAKLFEYMALGKPIISTPHPALEKYRDHVLIVNNETELAETIKGIQSGEIRCDSGAMIETARRHLWDRKAETILTDIHYQIDDYALDKSWS